MPATATPLQNWAPQHGPLSSYAVVREKGIHFIHFLKLEYPGIEIVTGIVWKCRIWRTTNPGGPLEDAPIGYRAIR